MSEFIYCVHYRPGFRMVKPNSLSRYLVKEKSRIYAQFFDEVQLLDQDNDDVGDDENVEDMQIKEIDMVTRERKDGL